MADQDGLRFLFEIQDKISAKLAKIEAKAKASAAKIDKAFTKASRSQEANAARAIAAEKRRIAAVEKAHAKSIKLLKRQSDAFKRSMTRLASASAVAFAVVSGKALDMAGGYDAAMRSVQAKTGATGAVLEKLSEQAREMGRTTVHSATAAARGQAFLAQAGFEAHEILVALPPVLALATAGELDLASAADIASNVLSGFQMETKEMARVVDVLALAAASSNTSVAQMGAAMAKAAPAAKAAGWSLEATAAAIGKLSDAGIQGEEAGTVLNTMMARLGNASGSAEAKLRELGIEVKDATTGAMLPLNDILTALAPHADDVGLQFELLGNRGAKAGFILGAVSEDARKLTGELEDAGGSAQRMADIMGGGLWGTLKAIGSAIDDAFISFGELLAPALQVGLDLFRKLPGPIRTTTIIIGSLVGAMGGLMLIMPQSFGALVQLPGKLIALAKSIKGVAAVQWLMNAAMTANPIGLVVAAVALLVGGLYLLFTKTEIGREAFEAISHVAKAVFTTAINLARMAIKWLAKWAGIAKDEIAAMIPKWVSRSVEWLGKKVAVVTGKIKDFNKGMEAQAKVQKEATKNWGISIKVWTKAERQADKTAKAEAKRAKAGAKAAAARDKAAKKAADAEKKAKKAAEESAKAVDALTDAWTGATLQSDEFLRAFRRLTPEQKENDRIMDQVIRKYDSMRRVLGPLDDGLEKVWRATQRWTPSLVSLNREQEKIEPAAVAAGKGIAALSSEIKNGTHELGAWDLIVQESNKSMLAQLDNMHEFKGAASGYELALAGMAGQMGGATGQALNLVIAMREHNKEQKAAAAAGKKTEAQFGKMRMGAGKVAFAFSAIGESIGGTAGAVLSELGNVASAFATGGVAAGIMAGAIALGKAIFGIFTRGKRKRAAAAKKEAEAAKIVADAAAAAAKTHAEAVEALRLAWLNLPTDQIVLGLTAIRDAWDALGVDDRTTAFEEYVKSLISARDAGAELTAAELNAITLFEEHQGKRTAMLARHKAEMAGFDTQIAALESLLQTKISEVDALIAQQEAELDALSVRQDAEIAALATRRRAALDSIMAVQTEQLALLKEMQSKELAEMQAAQAAELNALKAARAAALGVVEAAIQRELEDERIAAQLTIDLRKAGSDQGAIDAAHARAATSTERLLERDELNDLMAEAEARVRARYQGEMDAINAHWDEVEAETTTRHRDALTELDEIHAHQLTALETAHGRGAGSAQRLLGRTRRVDGAAAWCRTG